MSTWPVGADRTLWPITRGVQGHLSAGQAPGVDIAADQFIPLLPFREAQIVRVGDLGTCGLSVDYRFDWKGSDLEFRYCHMAMTDASVGDITDDVIGFVGSTGFTTDNDGNPAFAPHLHITAWRNGVRVDALEELIDELMAEEEHMRTSTQQEIIDVLRVNVDERLEKLHYWAMVEGKDIAEADLDTAQKEITEMRQRLEEMWPQ